ncbi:hypothetical protein BV25DRAFT_147314 [Artomyces pyxidatus]|uniref:Uncharacterized protein n=1 Tax=Artomyces pyxidatus TaxID=48021 RepID=A0ACB8T8S3_9AGAM|nr:hypothetical protein BV25DRAFT_147314 [Artomyces pyxidatus]
MVTVAQCRNCNALCESLQLPPCLRRPLLSTDPFVPNYATSLPASNTRTRSALVGQSDSGATQSVYHQRIKFLRIVVSLKTFSNLWFFVPPPDIVAIIVTLVTYHTGLTRLRLRTVQKRRTLPSPLTRSRDKKTTRI